MRWLLSNSLKPKEAIKSTINVSLTYLRGLDIPELTEEVMPVIEL